MCCLCLKRMLRDDDVREYICKIDGCHVKYDLSDILEMYEKSISDTSLKIFAYPGSNCSMTGCSKLTLLKLIKCNHSLCWECITKGSTAENREIERQLSMKCPVRNCGTSFPLDCLKYYVQCLMSSMQLVTYLHVSKSKWF
ncbi:uncharacterized protein LOC133178709 [Saccostrea echinata]|uniref:uncharacterized protein LOC133178709 n=1 Tax=Saccostrea echinata TaxID=191078 RepID=UPI002A817EF5|nr:uncharacterized protein LOC133178709 [Saccostrea echinata]